MTRSSLPSLPEVSDRSRLDYSQGTDGGKYTEEQVNRRRMKERVNTHPDKRFRSETTVLIGSKE